MVSIFFPLILDFGTFFLQGRRSGLQFITLLALDFSYGLTLPAAHFLFFSTSPMSFHPMGLDAVDLRQELLDSAQLPEEAS